MSSSSKNIRRYEPVKKFYVHSNMNRKPYGEESKWLLEELNLDHIDLKVIE